MANIFDLFKKIESSPQLTITHLVVGLGNPEPKYTYTRHNAGFLAIDYLCQSLGVKCDRLKFKALIGEATINGVRVLLMKLQTYMNLSGEAVIEASSFYKIPPERVLVLHDEISFEPGLFRIRRKGSAGGHNGLKSIIAHLASEEFPRVKIGVGKKPSPDYDLADWVLSSFSAQEEKALEPALTRAADAALCILERGTTEAANRYNGG